MYNICISVRTSGKVFEQITYGRWLGGEIFIERPKAVPAEVLDHFQQERNEILWQGEQQTGRWRWCSGRLYEVSFEKSMPDTVAN